MRTHSHLSWLLVALLPVLLQGSILFSVGAEPTGDEIMKKVVERAQLVQQDIEKLRYTYQKIANIETLDSAGKVKERKEKVFHYVDGLGYLKSCKVNGKVVSKDVSKEEENAINEQKKELTQEGKSERDDNWEKHLTPELITKYNFRLSGTQVIAERSAFILTFQPKPNLPAKKTADRFLNQLSGTIWVDKEDYEIARAEIGLKTKVTLGGGVLEWLGAMKRFDYVLERTRLEDNVWFNQKSNGDFEIRKLFSSSRVKTSSECQQFTKSPFPSRRVEVRSH